MPENYTIISSDCHAGGNMAAYRQYLDPDFHDEFDEWRGAYTNPFKDLQEEVKKNSKERNWDNQLRNSELDSDGVVGEIVFPNTVPPFFPTGALITPPPTPENFQRRLAGIRAHNRWLADWCAEYPERRAGIAQIFLNDMDEAIKDVEFAKENNLRGGVLLPGIPPDSKHLAPFHDPKAYERLWDACEDLEVNINHHSGGGTPNYGKHPTSGVMYLIEVPFFSHRPLHFLLMSGVFQRHPKLKVIFTEQGVSWVPPLLTRLDAIHEQMRSGRVGELGFEAGIVLDEKPSQYFHNNCYIGASFPSPNEASAIEEVGWENVMWGNDYPHQEGCYPYTKESLQLSFSGIDSNKMKMILSENQAKVYDFDLGALAPMGDEFGPSVKEIATPLKKVPNSPSPAFTRS